MVCIRQKETCTSKKQHPKLDVRIVFENSKRKIRKGSNTTYGMWCDKNDILFYDRIIPLTWMNEKIKFMPPKIVTIEERQDDNAI